MRCLIFGKGGPFEELGSLTIAGNANALKDPWVSPCETPGRPAAAELMPDGCLGGRSGGDAVENFIRPQRPMARKEGGRQAVPQSAGGPNPTASVNRNTPHLRALAMQCGGGNCPPEPDLVLWKLIYPRVFSGGTFFCADTGMSRARRLSRGQGCRFLRIVPRSQAKKSCKP